jgi:Tol biopolymer transport system component
MRANSVSNICGTIGFAAIAAILALVSSCGGGEGAVGGIGDPSGYRPQFPFQFEGVTKAPGSNTQLVIKMNFITKNVSTDGTTGEFDAATNISLNDFSGPTPITSTASLVGTFSQKTLSLTVTPSIGSTYPFPAQYQGAFSDDNTVVLNPVGGGTSFTLRRNKFEFIPALTGNWAGQSGSGQPWLMQLRTEFPYSEENDATVLLSGTEVLAGQFSKITGYASVRAIVLSIERPSGPVQVSGDLSAATGKFTTEVKFGNSTTLARGGLPDSTSAIFLVGDQTMQLKRADLGGQPLVAVTEDIWAEQSTSNLAASPNGQQLAVVRTLDSGDLGLVLYSFGTGLTSPVPTFTATEIVSDIVWSPDSQSLVFAAITATAPSQGIYLVTSPSTTPQWRKLSGMSSGSTVLRSLAWAPAGQSLSFLSTTTNYSELFVQASPGTTNWNPTPISSAFNPMGAGGGIIDYRWAPSSAQMIALTVNTVAGAAQSDLYTIQSNGAGLQKLATSSDGNLPFAWQPNASSLAFGIPSAGMGANNFAIFLRPADASSAAIPISDAIPSTSLEWNPAGTALLALTQPQGMLKPVWSVVSVSGSGRIDLAEPGNCEAHGHWSADGSWIAYTRVINPDFGSTCRYDAARADGAVVQAVSPDVSATSDFRFVDANRLVFQSDQDRFPGTFDLNEELFIGQAGGSGNLKISSAPYDRQPVGYGWVLRKP